MADNFAALPLVLGKRELVAKRQRMLASYEVAGGTAKQVLRPESTPDSLHLFRSKRQIIFLSPRQTVKTGCIVDKCAGTWWPPPGGIQRLRRGIVVD